MPLGCVSALDWKRRELPGGSLGPKACFAKIISVWFLSRGYQLGSRGAPCSVGDSATLVRGRRLGIRRVGRVLLDAADEIERGVERLVVLRIRRGIGLRAGLLVALRFEVSAHRSFAARVGVRLELPGHLLQPLDVGRNALRLDGASGRGEVAPGCQP